jgi:adenylosuccinate synthase
MGVGEARSYRLRAGINDPIRFRDLFMGCILEDKLALMRDRFLEDLQEMELTDGCERHVGAFDVPVKEIARQLRKEVPCHGPMPSFKVAVFEGAQGMLIDERVGFHPHTTWSDVSLRNALELAEEAGVEEACSLGVTRAYATRHGPGPFPTEDANLSKAMTDRNNPEGLWQGKMRFGWLDLPLLRYAANNCGAALDGIAVNCIDQLRSGSWKGYRKKVSTFLQSQLDRPMGHDLSRQETLGRMIAEDEQTMTVASMEEILEAIGTVAPVAVESRGPCWTDRKVTREFEFRKLERRTP